MFSPNNKKSYLYDKNKKINFHQDKHEDKWDTI